MELALIIVLAVVIVAVVIVVMVIAFLIAFIVLVRLIVSNNDQFMYSNFEWADRYHKTVSYYEDELQGLYNDIYGDEEELKN